MGLFALLFELLSVDQLSNLISFNAHSGPGKISKVELSVKIANDLKLFGFMQDKYTPNTVKLSNSRHLKWRKCLEQRANRSVTNMTVFGK